MKVRTWGLVGMVAITSIAAGDVGARIVAESRVAGAAPCGTRHAEAHVRGFPASTQVMREHLNSVRLDLTGMPSNGFSVDVAADLSDVSTGNQHVRAVDGEAQVDWHSLDDSLPALSSDAARFDAGSSQRSGDLLSVEVRLPLRFGTIPARVLSSVELSGSNVVATPVAVEVFGHRASLSDLPSRVQDLADLEPVTVTPDLPVGVNLTSIAVRDGGIATTFNGKDVVLQPNETGPGGCTDGEHNGTSLSHA